MTTGDEGKIGRARIPARSPLGRFTRRLTVGLLGLFFTMAVLAALLATGNYLAAPIVLGTLAVAQAALLYRYLRRTNTEVARFLEAAHHADFSQSFTFAGQGAGFEKLGATLTEIMERFRQSRASQEQELRYLRALVEQVPVPLVSIDGNERVAAVNNAARRLLGPGEVTCLADLRALGPQLASAAAELGPGHRKVVDAELHGGSETLALSVSEIVAEGRRLRLISMHNIRGELENAEVEAWQRLVRVLTHEIGNSITPVASLAHTAADMVRDMLAGGDRTELSEVYEAVSTVARRSDGLMAFVQDYRELTRLASPQRTPTLLVDLFARLRTLVAAQWQDERFTLVLDVMPQSLEINADPAQLEQVLLNLVKNAAEAMADRSTGRIEVRARLNQRGRVVIEVGDDGPGVPGSMKEKIFLPFFTTKRGGSGIGLALTRQVMISHGGSVSVDSRRERGALFRLTF